MATEAEGRVEDKRQGVGKLGVVAMLVAALAAEVSTSGVLKTGGAGL